MASGVAIPGRSLMSMNAVLLLTANTVCDRLCNLSMNMQNFSVHTRENRRLRSYLDVPCLVDINEGKKRRFKDTLICFDI